MTQGSLDRVMVVQALMSSGGLSCLDQDVLIGEDQRSRDWKLDLDPVTRPKFGKFLGVFLILSPGGDLVTQLSNSEEVMAW